MHASRMRRRFSTLLVLGSALTFAFSGCSIFYDLNANQCEQDEDCVALGVGFEDRICRNNTCVKLSSSGGTGGTGGNGGTGGDSSGGTGGKGGGGTGGSTGGAGGSTGGAGGSTGGAGGSTGGKGGSSTGGKGGTDGTSGEGGAPPEPECTTNSDCIEAQNAPFICREGSCVAATNASCPVLLPQDGGLGYLGREEPILVGGFANLGNPNNRYDSLAVANWDLAFEEFNEALAGGLPGDGERRPLVGIVCHSGDADIIPSVRHLALELDITQVLTTLSADKLIAAFEYTDSLAYAQEGGRPVFFMSTSSADLRLANLVDRGLVWHMLGDPRVLAATTASLVTRIEPFIDEKRLENFMATGVDDPGTVPLRVTLVSSNEATMTDIANVLTTSDVNHPETLLTFNDDTPASQQAGSGDFRSVEIESLELDSDPDVAAAITSLQTNPPHLVVAMATAEFPSRVMSAVEATWGAASSASEDLQRPYYVLSQRIYNRPELPSVLDQFVGVTPPLEERVLGVNFALSAEARATTLYSEYLGRLLASYEGTLNVAGTENMYDAAYSLFYAIAAASWNGGSFHGEDIADAIKNRVLAVGSGTTVVDVGPGPVVSAAPSFSSVQYKMSLYGTMGPPNFERTSGTRVTATSAWCLLPNSSPPPPYTFAADGLLYNADSQLFEDPTGGPPSCLAAY